MFGELTREATNLAERTNVLQARIDRLAIKVTQLDSGVEEGMYLHGIIGIFQTPPIYFLIHFFVGPKTV